MKYYMVGLISGGSWLCWVIPDQGYPMRVLGEGTTREEALLSAQKFVASGNMDADGRTYDCARRED